MKHLTLIIALLFGVILPSHASRYAISNRHAFKDSTIAIVRGKVIKELHSREDGVAFYEIEISEIIKPSSSNIPLNLTVIDSMDNSTAEISLDEGENAVLFLQKRKDKYTSEQEFNLDTENGVQKLDALRTFLQLMSIPKKNKQVSACIEAWKDSLTYHEKMAVMDAMWETRSTSYAPLLIKIANSQENNYVRGWAITIFTGNDAQAKELIPLLEDLDYSIVRQSLLALSHHKVKEAIPQIEKLLTKDFGQTLAKSYADDIRNRAKEALAKINEKVKQPHENRDFR